LSLDLWAQVGDCFDSDDGSLPGIRVTNLSPAGLSAVYAMLRRRSHSVGNYPAEFWSRTGDQSVLVDSIPDPAALVAAGEAEAFHFCIGGLVAGGVELPVLGVFVWTDAIELDYRMGPDWGPAQVAGFFELLRDCCALDPGTSVVPEEGEGPPNNDRFRRAWAAYMCGNFA
jgi:hypothetical protein